MALIHQGLLSVADSVDIRQLRKQCNGMFIVENLGGQWANATDPFWCMPGKIKCDIAAKAVAKEVGGFDAAGIHLLQNVESHRPDGKAIRNRASSVPQQVRQDWDTSSRHGLCQR